MSESVCYESQSLHPWVQKICVMAASEMIAMMKVLPGWVTVFSITEGEHSEAQHLLLNLCVDVTPCLNAMPFK